MAIKVVIFVIWYAIGLLCQFNLFLRAGDDLTLADFILIIISAVFGPIIWLFFMALEKARGIVVYKNKSNKEGTNGN